MTRTYELTFLVYDRSAVDATIAAFGDRCSARLTRQHETGCSVEITADSAPERESNVAGDFLNHLLCLSIETKLGREGGAQHESA